MLGVNSVIISGNVGDRIVFGETRTGVPACSFSVASDASSSNSTWVRVCAYADLVPVCRERLRRGIYVLVEGELMNRPGSYGGLTEVRARRLVFFDRSECSFSNNSSGNRNDNRDVEGDANGDASCCSK